MSRSCKNDRNTECLHDCPGCSRYYKKACNCGATDNLVEYKDEYYCAECLAQRFVAEADSVVASFIDDCFDEFVKHVSIVC